MKYLPWLLLSCMAWGQTAYVDLTKITRYCDLSVDGVCFDRSDGQGHKVPFTAEDQKKVGLYILEPKPPESMDVPAIKEMRKECVLPTYTVSSSFSCGQMTKECLCGTLKNVPRDSCADKSRILLTDESGGKHCIKFPSGSKD